MEPVEVAAIRVYLSTNVSSRGWNSNGSNSNGGGSRSGIGGGSEGSRKTSRLLLETSYHHLHRLSL